MVYLTRRICQLDPAGPGHGLLFLVGADPVGGHLGDVVVVRNGNRTVHPVFFARIDVFVNLQRAFFVVVVVVVRGAGGNGLWRTGVSVVKKKKKNFSLFP
jgi:hypothetical protein